MAMNVTLGTITVDSVRVTLDDGRIVDVHSDGSINVRNMALGSFGNEYMIDLPTVEDVARKCDATGRTGDVMIPAIHRC